ncbi:MAG: N(5)-(carboxyethyl)ornithine synthase [Solirubrobacteraceae bacterium]
MATTEPTVGVYATSRKPDERRLAIHPAHFDRIDETLRARIFLETGYGERFGVSDADLAPLVGGLLDRDALGQQCDVLLLPKPLLADLEALRPGQVVWGWPHCVQDEALTQLAIDRELTLIAWEAMNHWTGDGNFNLHVFHKNNELAGYCSVLHALSLIGSTGDYGRRLNAAVISFGATARGAVRGLLALGVSDVTVFTQRDSAAVASPFSAVRMEQFARDGDGTHTVADDQPFGEVLANFDVVVNCILQDTEAPLMFVLDDELQAFSPGSLVIDVSCDDGMGFEWARPTTFADPTFAVGPGVHHYAVDHTPSYLWNSATWENSVAVLEHLPTVMAGPDAWQESDTIRRAIEISDGRVLNPRILSFQGRSPQYPHEVGGAQT